MGDYLPPNPLTKDKGGIWARRVKDGLITLGSNEEPSFSDFSSSSDAPNITLTSELLLKRGLFKDQSCICEVDVSCLGLEGLEPDLHLKLTSLKKLVAADNTLSLECFEKFNSLVELDLSLNQINSLSSYSHGFNSLHYLNLSYNFLQSADIEKLGYLPSLRILYLSGNDLRRLPPDFSETSSTLDERIVFKFAKLEILYLDDNKLSDAQDFASLGTLPRLTYLNLANNRFTTVPLLKSTPLKRHQITKAQNNSTIENIPFSKSPTSLNETIQHDSLLIGYNEKDEDNKSLVINGRSMKTSHHYKWSSDDSSGSNKKQLTNNLCKIMNKQSLEKTNNLSSLTRKEPREQQQNIKNCSLSLDEHRNPNAPRVRIVDEFIGLYNLKKLFPLIHDKQTKCNHQGDCKSIQLDSDFHMHKSNSGLLLTAKERSTPDRTFTTDELVSLDNEEKCDIQSKIVPPPFQSLQSIDLSHNRISCEEHLLPIAVWPKLKECIIYANPIISKSSRIPPLLERLLIQQLHINLCRNPIDNPNLFEIKNTSLLERNELNSCLQHISPTQNQNFGNNDITTVSSGTNTMNRLSHKNIPEYKMALNKDKQGKSYHSSMKPVVIRYKLDKSSLDLGPKMIKCNVNQILDEMKLSNQTNLVNPSQLSLPTTTATSIASVKLSNLSNSSTLNDSFQDNPSIYNKISHSLQFPTIERYKTFIKNDSQKFDQNLPEFLANLQCDEQIEEENEDMNNFFTTQLSSVNTANPTEHHTAKFSHSDYNQFHQQNNTENDNDQSNEYCEDKTLIKCPTTSGPLLSNLECIIDEKRLPNSMQACLRELRYLLQHKPTIHAHSYQHIIRPPLTLPGDNHQSIEYSTASLSSSSSPKLIENVINSKVEVSSEKSCNQISSKNKIPPRNTSSSSLSSMKLVPVCNDLEILPSKINLNQFTGFTEIPLTKALKDEEIQKRQLEKIRAKQNPLARKLKLVKNSNQPKRTKLKGPKELFEQIQVIYSNVREQAITEALNKINQDFDKKTEQICQNI